MSSIPAFVMARFKLWYGDYAVLGCDDTHPGSRGGLACPLGDRRNARMASERLMPAPDHPLHRCRFFGMKRRNRARQTRLLPSDPGTLTKTADQTGRPGFNKSRISVSNFSSFEGPGVTVTGFLKRLTCLMTMKRQKAMIKNSMTVLMNIP